MSDFFIKKQYFKILFFITTTVIFILAIVPNDHIDLGFVYADKIKHVTAFFVLSLLLNRSSSRLKHRLRNMGALLLFGIFIELIQSFISYRTASPDDIIADVTGILLFQLFYSLLRLIRYRKK
ncbi:MAG TPA: antibiotic resistance protein VanZ [Campylobacterales bacterium]|nr:antibiotic resistance protein VanZ [Campylobacterales bacterium]